MQVVKVVLILFFFVTLPSKQKLKYLIKFVSTYRIIPVVERKTKKIIDIINFKKLKQFSIIKYEFKEEINGYILVLILSKC